MQFISIIYIPTCVSSQQGWKIKTSGNLTPMRIRFLFYSLGYATCVCVIHTLCIWYWVFRQALCPIVLLNFGFCFYLILSLLLLCIKYYEAKGWTKMSFERFCFFFLFGKTMAWMGLWRIPYCRRLRFEILRRLSFGIDVMKTGWFPFSFYSAIPYIVCVLFVFCLFCCCCCYLSVTAWQDVGPSKAHNFLLGKLRR